VYYAWTISGTDQHDNIWVSQRSAPTSDVFLILLLFPEIGKQNSPVAWDLGLRKSSKGIMRALMDSRGSQTLTCPRPFCLPAGSS
jgi:hypothetical protein